MTATRRDAQRRAQEYFQAVAEKAGLEWDSEHDREIADLVDAIIDATKDELAEDIRRDHSLQRVWRAALGL